jgi:phosphomannomutase
MISENIFRKYDIRGIVDQDFHYSDAYKIALAFAEVLKELKITKISIGYDGRKSSVELSEKFQLGIIESGIDVLNIGLVPSPCLYFSVHHLNLNAGVMITGSHNPKEYNGIKFMIKDMSFFDEDIKKLYHRINVGDFTQSNIKGSVDKIDVKSDYIKNLTHFIDKSKLPNIAFDGGNGASGEIIQSIANIFNIPKKNLLYCDIDGDFPNHHPDPTVEKNMQDISKLVLENHCDVGIAFDGDADRIGIVDDLGRFVAGDILVAILSKYLLMETGGGKIIADVKASKVLFDEIAKNGGEPIMYKTGHSFIKKKLKSENALLAGEMSGHIFYNNRYFGFDDGIYAAMRLIEIMQKYNVKLSELIDSYPKMCNTPEIKVFLPEEIKFEIADQISELLKVEYHDHVDIDGIRVNFDHGWMLIRASNTQNCLVCRCESSSETGLNDIKIILQNTLLKHNLSL